jgi:hypothetical protein
MLQTRVAILGCSEEEARSSTTQSTKQTSRLQHVVGDVAASALNVQQCHRAKTQRDRQFTSADQLTRRSKT